MTFKSVMGVLSVIIMVIAYAVYMWQTARSEDVRPHPFSWFLWGFVTAVVYLVQITQKRRTRKLGCRVYGNLLLSDRHTQSSSNTDGVSRYLIGCQLLLGCWYSDTTWLLRIRPSQRILATITDVIGYGSTIKKGWVEPHKDSATSFALNSLKFVPSLFALQAYSLATWLYPATLVLMNGAVALMLRLAVPAPGLSAESVITNPNHPRSHLSSLYVAGRR